MLGSPYLHWLDHLEPLQYNLASSGVMPCGLHDLPLTWDAIELNRPYIQGYHPLVLKIAEHQQVKPENVLRTAGTSMANYIVLASLLYQGGEVLLETPTYDPLLHCLDVLPVKLQRLHRLPDNDFGIDFTELKQKITKNTKLIVLTNFHNPSGRQFTQDELSEIAEIAKSVNAYILIDEVYREALFTTKPNCAYHLDKQFIVTSSLTKAYGLGGLRCGWIIAKPELIQLFSGFNEITENCSPHPVDTISVAAFQHLPQLAQRAKQILTVNRAKFYKFIESQPEIEMYKNDYATTYFPKFKNRDAQQLAEKLRKEYSTLVIPGSFFEMPNHLRIGIGAAPENFVQGLNYLATALQNG